jgi:TetR/AcrR family transcriptional repressor of mexJK operon
MIEEALSLRPGRPKDVAKREDIILAATALFMHKGFELTSMEAVAKQANVSKLTIYSHFADKNELFRGVVELSCQRMGMPTDFSAEGALPVEQALTQIATHAMTHIFREDTIRLMRIIQAEAGRQPEMVQTYYDHGPRRIKTAFADLLREFDRQGQVSIPDATRATEQFFSLLKGEKLMRILMLMAPFPEPDEIAAHVKSTVTFFLSAYRPRQDSRS